MHNLFNIYANLLIPGLDDWPSYNNSKVDTFWADWRKKSPLSTRLALAFSIFFIHAYCTLNLILGTPKEKSLGNMEGANTFIVRQAYLMLKSLACLAYFSDPDVYKLASAYSESDKASSNKGGHG
jgi:hypothetical protein